MQCWRVVVRQALWGGLAIHELPLAPLFSASLGTALRPFRPLACPCSATVYNSYMLKVAFACYSCGVSSVQLFEVSSQACQGCCCCA